MPFSMLDSTRLAPLSAGIGTTRKVITVQMDFIKGGYLLTVYVSHGFVDAWGAWVVIAAWAKNCRELQEASTRPSESVTLQEDRLLQAELDPTALRRNATPVDYETLKQRPELWRLLNLD